MRPQAMAYKAEFSSHHGRGAVSDGHWREPPLANSFSLSYRKEHSMALDEATRRTVHAWMAAHAAEHFAYHFLAEACADALDLAAEDRDRTIPEEVYEMALAFFPDC